MRPAVKNRLIETAVVVNELETRVRTQRLEHSKILLSRPTFSAIAPESAEIGELWISPHAVPRPVHNDPLCVLGDLHWPGPGRNELDPPLLFASQCLLKPVGEST